MREVKNRLGPLTRRENEVKFYVSAKYQKVENDGNRLGQLTRQDDEFKSYVSAKYQKVEKS